MPNIAIIKHWMDKAETLEKKLSEKDAMIDWLCSKLQNYCDNPIVHNCDICRNGECHNNNWRKAAQEAVSKYVR